MIFAKPGLLDNAKVLTCLNYKKGLILVEKALICAKK